MDEETSGASELQTAAPGLYRDFSRIFGAGDLFELAQTFALSASCGGLDEGPINREDGASFNPRPARLCSIALKELKERDVSLFHGALSFYISDPAKLSQLPHISLAPWFFVSREIAMGTKPVQVIQSLSSGAEHAKRLLLLHALDMLRHLHMTSWNKVQRTVFLSWLQDELLPCADSIADNRLIAMLEHLLRRRGLAE